jgi:hypothetical protein
MAYNIDYLKMQLLSEELEMFNEERKSVRQTLLLFVKLSPCSVTCCYSADEFISR